MNTLNDFSPYQVMVYGIFKNSRIINNSASVPVVESETAENNDIDVMENMQDKDTDGGDEPDFDLDCNLRE